MQNPFWPIKTSEANKLIILLKKLPIYEEGIPETINEKYKGCVLDNLNGSRITCHKGFVISYVNNLIEIKQDSDYTIENEILRLAPDNIYKEVRHFI